MDGNNGRILIKTGQAREDVSNILNIVSTITECLDTLENNIKKYIPESIQTSWSEELRNNWESYYTTQIPAAMEEMKASALNLETIIAKAEGFSKQG